MKSIRIISKMSAAEARVIQQGIFLDLLEKQMQDFIHKIPSDKITPILD